jgi:hypothetical protein
MCFDPVSLALAAGGTAASVIGGSMNADAQQKAAAAQMQDNQNAANASNAVLQKFNAAQGVNQSANNAALGGTLGMVAPGAFQANQAAIAGAASNNASSAIASTLAGVKQPTLTNTDNGQTAAAIAARTGVMTGQSVRNANNAATLGAYGTNFAQLGLGEANSARQIDTTNNLARRQAQLLPTDEQNAALQARQYVPGPDYTAGTALQGLGNIFATMGGSGAGSRAVNGAGSFLSGLAPSISNPGLNLSTSNGFSVGGA